jgi:hypothetical protein
LGIIDKAHDLIAGRVDARKKQHVEDVLHQLEADLAPLVGPIVQQVIDNPATSPELAALLSEAVEPGHQFGSLVVGFAIGSTLAPALSSALEPEFEAIGQAAWQQNPSKEITADTAAAAVLKGVLTQAEGAALARRSGINGTQFDHMVEAAGQSIGIAEALLLYRRGQIDRGHLDEIVRYSNVNPRFYDDVPKLQYGPPPAGEVIAGLLKGHLTQGEAATKLGHAGINPDELEWMRATAGRPPSPMEMVRLWHRNEATQGDVERAVAQSDINNDYLPFVLKLGRWYPPPRSIMAMVRSGGITDDRARQLFTYAGVPVDVQDDMIREAHQSKSETATHVKTLTSAQVVRMYSTRLIGRANANGKLLALNYSQADANLLLDFADDERIERLQAATINKVGAKYVAHRLNLNDATHLLTVAGVPNAAQTDLFALWNVQRDATVQVPSASAVVGAYRRGDIPPLECKNRLLNLGVQPQDLDIFVVDGWPPTKAAEGRAAALAVQNA